MVQILWGNLSVWLAQVIMAHVFFFFFFFLLSINTASDNLKLLHSSRVERQMNSGTLLQ